MARRALPALLALIALVADLSNSHRVSLVFLLAAIPAAFALTLECYGDTLEARCGALRPLTTGVAAALLYRCVEKPSHARLLRRPPAAMPIPAPSLEQAAS